MRRGIGAVGAQHGRHLVVAHGVDAAVGEHVQKHVGRVEAEGVELGLPDRLHAALDRDQMQFLHDTHLVQSERDVSAPVEFDFNGAGLTRKLKSVEAARSGRTALRGGE